MPSLFIASGIFHPESGGPATYLYEILPILQSRGWDVQVISYADALPNHTYPYPVTRVQRRSLPIRLAEYARKARPMLRSADLVYMHTLGLPLIDGFGGRRAPRVAKIVGDQAWERSIRRGWVAPMTDVDSFQTNHYSRTVHLQKGLRSREVRSLDGVIVPSQYLKRLVTGWGVDPDKIHVIYNALPSTTAEITLDSVPDLPEAPTFVTIARLTHWKGVDHLIAALVDVPDAHLVVIGDGEMRHQLESQAERFGVGERVTFTGRLSREQVAAIIREAAYVVLYSGYEGLSHTLLESLRAGTPVIASDKGGNPEVVQHGVNGLLVPHIDVEALAATLNAALAPGMRARLAANAHVGMERFDFAQMVDETDRVLRSYLA